MGTPHLDTSCTSLEWPDGKPIWCRDKIKMTLSRFPKESRIQAEISATGCSRSSDVVLISCISPATDLRENKSNDKNNMGFPQMRH